MNVTNNNLVPNKNTACVACQRRKAKCIGNPCAYCLKKDIVCEFSSAKKRGPKRVKLLSEQEYPPEFLNNSQETLNGMYHQLQFVEFYFQFIAKCIPSECKENLINNKVSSEHKTQIYIIAACMMKMYCNKELENQYINKAQKSSNLFNSDTPESAITLMMMTNYLGAENPRSRSFILVAHNTLNLPSTEYSIAELKARTSCEVMTYVLDPSLNRREKAMRVYDKISGDFGGLITHASTSELIKIGLSRSKILIHTLGYYDDYNVVEFLVSVKSPNKLNTQDYLLIIDTLNRVEKLVETTKESDETMYNYGMHIIRYYRFITEWRSGNTMAAYYEAVQAMNLLKDSMQVLAAWCRDGIVGLLAMPYFFKSCGLEELSVSCLNNIMGPFGNLGRKDEVKSIWEAMCGGSVGYNMAQLEADLLGAQTQPSSNTFLSPPLSLNVGSSQLLLLNNINTINNNNNNNSNNISNYSILPEFSSPDHSPLPNLTFDF